MRNVCSILCALNANNPNANLLIVLNWAILERFKWLRAKSHFPVLCATSAIFVHYEADYCSWKQPMTNVWKDELSFSLIVLMCKLKMYFTCSHTRFEEFLVFFKNEFSTLEEMSISFDTSTISYIILMRNTSCSVINLFIGSMKIKWCSFRRGQNFNRNILWVFHWNGNFTFCTFCSA